MPDLSSFTLGNSSISLGDFIVGYEAAAGPGSERRWTADDLTTGLLALAGATPAEVARLSGVTSNIQAQIDAASGGLSTHEARTDNPHTVTATQVGLGNVDNTSDLDKPISTLTQAAIDAAGAFSADANTLITPSTPIVLDEATGDEAALTIDYTTNKAAGNDTGLLINQTDTLSPGASNLLDLQVGGTSKFSVDSDGDVDIAGAYRKGGATILDSDATLFNVAVGTSALSDALLTGANNTATGYQCLLNNESGHSNTASGYRSLLLNTSGIRHTATGFQSLFNNVDGNYNTATGYQALYLNVSGSSNVATGYQSLYGNTASNNTSIGYLAGRYQSGGTTSLTTASNSVFIGYNAKGFEGANNQLVLGFAAESIGANSVVLGNDSIVTTALKGNVGIGTTTPGGKLDIDQGTLTDDAQALNISSTWNDPADTFTLIKADVTDTASAAGSKLLDLQVGGASKFSVGSGGNVFLAGDLDLGGQDSVGIGNLRASADNDARIQFLAAGFSFYGSSGVSRAVINISGLHVGTGEHIGWTNSNANGSVDLTLYRDAANTLAQRNGVNPQNYRIYNTADATVTNYERASIGWDADTFVIGTEAAGTGVDRALSFRVGGAKVISFFADGAARLLIDRDSVIAAKPLKFSPDGTHDIGASGSLRPRDAYFSGSIGLHGVTPPAQAAHIADATDATDVITRVNAILVALENIGITAAA